MSGFPEMTQAAALMAITTHAGERSGSDSDCDDTLASPVDRPMGTHDGDVLSPLTRRVYEASIGRAPTRHYAKSRDCASDPMVIGSGRLPPSEATVVTAMGPPPPRLLSRPDTFSDNAQSRATTTTTTTMVEGGPDDPALIAMHVAASAAGDGGAVVFFLVDVARQRTSVTAQVLFPLFFFSLFPFFSSLGRVGETEWVRAHPACRR